MPSTTAALTDLTADERRQVMAAHLLAAVRAAGGARRAGAVAAVADAQAALAGDDLDAAAAAVARAASELRRAGRPSRPRAYSTTSCGDEGWRHLAACIPALAR